MSRIAARFAQLKKKNKKAFVSFTSAGDPDFDTFSKLLAGLPKAGVDLIEIGMPFSDPMADGPDIERGNLRALAAGVKTKTVFAFVRAFRKSDDDTPIVLMGYANTVYAYGVEQFVVDARNSGVDGLIVVDLPFDEDAELRSYATTHDVDVIRLVTPTTDQARLKTIASDARGFVYYVSVAGTTGSKHAQTDSVKAAVDRIRPFVELPVGVGFGISTPERAREIAAVADAAIVGSAIVRKISASLDENGHPKPTLVDDVLAFVSSLAEAVHSV